MPTERMPRPAYVVDVDENSGKQVRGTVRSALKEKPKVSQRDSESKRTKKPHSDTGDHSKAVQVITEKETKLERRKSTSASLKSPRKPTRPPLSHENRTTTKISAPQRSPRDNPSHYGIPPTTSTYAPVSGQAPIAIPYRPRAVTTQTMPVQAPTFHHTYTTTGQGPPLSASAFYQPPMITPSYPPPSAGSYMAGYALTPLPNTPQHDYFADQMTRPIPARALAARFESIPRNAQAFDPIARTASAFGTRETRRPSMDGQFDDGYYEDSYASRVSDGVISKRDSIRAPIVRLKDEADALAMPPPPLPVVRPGILRRPATECPSEPIDTRREYDEPHEKTYLRERPRPRRPSANRNSVSYDLGHDSERVRVETANNGRRRQSYHGQSTSVGTGNGYEDQLNKAANYQADVGGPSVPLTADMLKKQQRRQGGSSRSTSSRDESDYRKSVTTRTTRSGMDDDENLTIKVIGQARVVVAGTQIDCNDGGEISISRNKSLRNGSERGSEFGGQRQIDDRRSRIDRPTGRSRISSTHSYTRSTPQYPMDNYF